jgi:hypothetical protein
MPAIVTLGEMCYGDISTGPESFSVDLKGGGVPEADWTFGWQTLCRHPPRAGHMPHHVISSTEAEVALIFGHRSAFVATASSMLQSSIAPSDKASISVSHSKSGSS